MVTSENLVAVMRSGSGLNRALLPIEACVAVMATIVARIQSKLCFNYQLRALSSAGVVATGHKDTGRGFHHCKADV